MEVLNERAAMVSNYEVFTLLQEKLQADAAKTRHRKPQQENLATISYEVMKYLDKTHCKLQNETVIQDFLAQVAPFKLTKGEKLQLLNLRPTTPVEIQLIIEESEDRLRTDEELEQLLEIVAKLPANEENTEESEEKMQEDAAS